MELTYNEFDSLLSLQFGVKSLGLQHVSVLFVVGNNFASNEGFNKLADLALYIRLQYEGKQFIVRVCLKLASNILENTFKRCLTLFEIQKSSLSVIKFQNESFLFIQGCKDKAESTSFLVF